jgi:hypothetical protein
MTLFGASAASPDGRPPHRTAVSRRAAARAALVAIAALALLVLAEAANITVTGTWIRSIGLGDLQGGPGSDLITTYESPAGQVTMRISGAGNRAWRVDVLRIDSSWHPDLVLSIRRTGNGTGPGTIAGGTAYLPILTTSQAFVTGSGNLSGIPFQERLSGVSVSIPAGSYATTIQYTVVDQ